MKRKSVLLPLVAVLVLGACTTMPSGPSQMALPGTGKNFDQFRIDDYDCRQYAGATVNNATQGQVSADSGVKSAAVGAGVGAVAGAAIGNSGRSAAAGAGLGLLVGALAGAGAGERSSYALQRNYDAGYTQCMYAKGHKVPVSGRVNYTNAAPAQTYATPPPPPPGNPPPPPPR